MIELDVRELSQTENVSSSKHLDGFEMSTQLGRASEDLWSSGEGISASQKSKIAEQKRTRGEVAWSFWTSLGIWEVSGPD